VLCVFIVCGLFENHAVIVVTTNGVLYFEPPCRRGATVLGDRVNVSEQYMSSGCNTGMKYIPRYFLSIALAHISQPLP
jgi:hypothetical protein